MLEYLKIIDLALMDAVELEFPGGFVAVTGETGAGKSILLGALSLLSGSRAEKTLIRQGAEACEVDAILRFGDTKLLDEALQSMDLPVCEDRCLLLHRSLSRSKSPKVRVNGQLTTVSNLQALGELWIDFHGPGEPQKLFSEVWQLTLLDLYARNTPDLAKYREKFRQWRQLLGEMDSLRRAERLSAEEQEFLQQQIALIDELNVSEENIEELEREHAKVSRGQELQELAGSLENLLVGEGGIAEQVGQLLHSARDLAGIDSSSQVLADRLESIAIECADLGNEYADLREAAESGESDLATLEQRMDRWLGLKRKYGGSVASVLEKRQQLSERLSRQGDVEGSLKRLQRDADKLVAELETVAEGMREKRVKASRTLARETAALLTQLGFKKARLEIEIVREKELTEHGNSRCRFVFAPNAGQDLLPLNKIASSGELARVMLALKTVLAKVDATPVLVFDEVDSNIGGEIARQVGTQLELLGHEHQVFCITHLPQVAARAASHYMVQKDQTEDETRVAILALHDSAEARLDELTRMLGDRTSSSARRHAEELLVRA